MARSLVFLHANGFGPEIYRQFLGHLARTFDITAPDLCAGLRADAPPASWSELAADRATWIAPDRADERVVGVGHSMGALVLLHAIAEEPGRFSHAVLLDPPFLSKALLLSLRMMPRSWRTRGGMARKASSRPERWSDQQSAFSDFRSRRAFARIPDDVLWDYVREGTRREGSDFVLRFPRALEVALHSSPPNMWRALEATPMRVAVVRGSLSHVCAEKDVMKAARPDDRVITLEDVGHLLPLEAPERTARVICELVA